jgi:hypothetical protein
MYKEEIFGPILALRTFKTEEEAIELANDTEFGLNGENNPLLFQLMLEKHVAYTVSFISNGFYQRYITSTTRC